MPLVLWTSYLLLSNKIFSRGAENPLPSPCLLVLAGSGLSGKGGAVGWDSPQAEEELDFNSNEFPTSFPFRKDIK